MNCSSKKRSGEDLEDEEKGSKRSKLEEEVKEKSADQNTTNISHLLINNLKRPSLTKLTSRVYLSNFKNSFMNAIWKLEVPIADFNANFRSKENFNVRPGVPCSLLLDYSGKNSEITFSVQLGSGEDLEKFFEIERILNGSNEEVIDMIQDNVEKIDLLQAKIDLKINNGASHSANSPKAIVVDSNVPEGKMSPDNVNENLGYNINYKVNSPITPKGLYSSDKNASWSEATSLKFSEHENEQRELSDCMNTDTPLKNSNQENLNILQQNLMPASNEINSITPNWDRLQAESSIKNNSNKNSFDSEMTAANKENINSSAAYPISQIVLALPDTNTNANGNYFNTYALNSNSHIESNTTSTNIRKNESSKSDTGTYIVNLSMCIVNFKFFHINNNKISPGDIMTNKFKICKQTLLKSLKEEAIIVIEISASKIMPELRGYLGIVNEGMTCYMNSMLQTLNVLSFFKKAVFQIPVHPNDKNSVSYSLQKIFFELMTEAKPISTLRLIKSFGWGREQLMVQHDVQEFNLILSDIMETKMKGTAVEGTYKYLFEGRTLNYIECLNVNYKSSKEENFHDIQLTVQGCKDIYESFDKYTEEEILDNEDKYEAEGLGKQVAKKGVKFLKFPNVLILQLKRFEYNFNKDSMEKVNDFFEFSETIDLNKYTANNQEDNIFTLHSVMIHSGSTNAGHYYAFIRPQVESNWVKFNDEVVKPADEYEVFQNNFGGVMKTYMHISGGRINENEYKSDSNAYILVYIKNRERDIILSKLTVDDIPLDLRKSFEMDQNEEKIQMMLNLRQNTNFNIFLFSKETIVNYNLLGLLPSFLLNVDEGVKPKLMSLMTLNVPKELKIGEFIKFISDVSKIPREKIKLFKFVYLFQNVLKRFMYEMVYIEESRHNDKLREINEIKPSKMFYLFIHIEASEDNFSLLEHNNNFGINNNGSNYNYINLNFPNEEEFVINEESNQIVYYNKTVNFWRIHQNNNNNVITKNKECDVMIAEVKEVDDVDGNNKENHIYNNTYKNDFNENDNCVLFAIKFLNLQITNSNEMQTNLVLDDIVALKKNQSLQHLIDQIDFKEKYRKYLDPNFIHLIKDYDLAKVSFMVENTSLQREGRGYEFRSIFNCKTDLAVEGFKKGCICLIVNLDLKENLLFFDREYSSLSQIISDVATSLQMTISVPFYFIPDKRLDALKTYKNEIKHRIRIDRGEDELKKEILTSLKSDRDLVRDLLDLHNIDYFIVTYNSHITNIHNFIQNSHESLIELSNLGDKDRDLVSFYNDLPLLRYIIKKMTSSFLYHIKFSINFLTKEQSRHFYFLDLVLYDKDDNSIRKYGLTLPRNLTRCKQILSFLNEREILYTHYSEEIDSDDDFEFLFIIQNPETKIAYDLLLNKEEILTKYEEQQKIPFEYRLQPYEIEDKRLLTNSNKVFLAFTNKDGSCVADPIVLFFDYNTTTLGLLKNCIIEKMKKMNAFENLEDNGELSYPSKIKFYTCTYMDYRPIKGQYMNPSFDDNLMSSRFFSRSKPNNIMVEVSYNTNKSIGNVGSNSTIVINSA